MDGLHQAKISGESFGRNKELRHAKGVQGDVHQQATNAFREDHVRFLELADQARESILSNNVETGSSENARVALIAAKDLLRTGPAAGFGQSQRPFRSLQRSEQQVSLLASAREQPLSGRFVAQEGEHCVHHDESSGLAYKSTIGGHYGMVLDQEEVGSKRQLEIREALPSEYLWRLGLMNVIFGDSIKIEAITPNAYGPPSIRTSQPWVDGEKPSMQEIREFMITEGFQQIPRAMLTKGISAVMAWYRIADCVMVYDTKDSNFIRSGDVITPIDLCLGIFPLTLMKETAALNGLDWPTGEL